MTRNRFGLVCGLVALWLAVSAAYWRSTDWRAYVDEGGGKGPWPKFAMPLWFQAAESSLIGLAVMGALLGLSTLGRRLVRRRGRLDS